VAEYQGRGGDERRRVPVGAAGAPTGAGAVKPDWAVHLENAALALLVGAVLLGVSALSRLVGLG
jgi:hypothetical protein